MNKRARFLLFAGTVLFGINCAFFELSCVDVGFHVRTGELVVHSGAIPAVNSFSFAQPDQPWLLHQWLPSVLFYGAWVCGQIPGLILAKALVIGLICATVYLGAVQISGERRSYWCYWLVFGMALAARPSFFVRPFIFSALLLALLQYCIAVAGTRSRKLLFVVPALMALSLLPLAVNGKKFLKVTLFKALSCRCENRRHRVAWRVSCTRMPAGLLLLLMTALCFF